MGMLHVVRPTLNVQGDVEDSWRMGLGLGLGSVDGLYYG